MNNILLHLWQFSTLCMYDKCARVRKIVIKCFARICRAFVRRRARARAICPRVRAHINQCAAPLQWSCTYARARQATFSRKKKHCGIFTIVSARHNVSSVVTSKCCLVRKHLLLLQPRDRGRQMLVKCCQQLSYTANVRIEHCTRYV